MGEGNKGEEFVFLRMGKMGKKRERREER